MTLRDYIDLHHGGSVDRMLNSMMDKGLTLSRGTLFSAVKGKAMPSQQTGDILDDFTRGSVTRNDLIDRHLKFLEEK